MATIFPKGEQTRVEVVQSVSLKKGKFRGFDHELCFQDCIYHFSTGSELGYRFIWKRDGKHLGHRGQARIPSVKDITRLLFLAKKAGWVLR